MMPNMNFKACPTVTQDAVWEFFDAADSDVQIRLEGRNESLKINLPEVGSEQKSQLESGKSPQSKKIPPRISIITATYNRPDFMCEALNSVQAQTDGDFEHLIINDGGSREVEKILKDYPDPRIRYQFA